MLFNDHISSSLMKADKEIHMRKTTKDALLIAFFAQKPSKKDEPFLISLSIICSLIILIGSMLRSTFLFNLGVGLIPVGPLTRGAIVGYKKNRGTDRERAYTILFWSAIAAGLMFLISLSALLSNLFAFSFVCLLAIPVAEGIIERKKD